jgi:trk system potassium uptake protein TrkH
MTLRGRILKLHPAILILASFLLVILAGTALLMLPWATAGGGIRWIDALFTATSAVCVTGLVVVDTGGFFTVFGQLTILVLIQVGGLGLMTISVALFRWVGLGVSFRHRLIMQDIFAHTPRKDIFTLVQHTIVFTLAAEAVGAVLLAASWHGMMPWPRAIYTAVFHSVSAFCNAGFSLFADNLMGWRGDIAVNLTICALIVLGGIGFPVIYELKGHLAHPWRWNRLSIHARTVLTTTLALIAAGALMFALLEPRGLYDAEGSSAARFLVPLFQTITCRTAGFNTVDIGALQDATLAVMILLMFFGASPGSCGGGVKTTTLAVIIALTISRIRNRKRVLLFHKSVPEDAVNRSIALLLVSVGLIALVLFMLLAGRALSGGGAGRPAPGFLHCLFETVSAFGTVGLSMNTTPLLGTWGKSWIVLMMIIGRVGVLTFAYVITGAAAANGYEYAEENLMIG